MIKTFWCLALAACLAACSNNKTDATQTESAPVTPGIENTHGNIPDTNSTIRLNQNLQTDSSNLNDSVPR